MCKTVLITLGRLPKGLELASAFAGAGCRVLMADPWRWHLSRVSRAVDRNYLVTAPNTDVAAYHRDLLQIIDRERVDLVVPVSEETLHVAGLAGQLPGYCRLNCLDQSVLLKLHDKLGFVERAAAHGLPVPTTRALDTDEAKQLAERGDYVVKPRFSSAGHGLFIGRAGQSLPVMDEPAVVQAFLPGEELSAFAIAHEGRVIGTVVYRALITSGCVAVCFEILPEPDAQIVEWIRGFVAAENFSGFIAFDFRRDADGLALPMECNPRSTSGIHFIDPDDLAAAALAPERMQHFRLRREQRLQQFYPALTETQATGLRGGQWRQNLPLLFGCRDVSWSARDPLPFLLMPFTCYEILRRTIFSGMSFGEASTVDIGWY